MWAIALLLSLGSAPAPSNTVTAASTLFVPSPARAPPQLGFPSGPQLQQLVPEHRHVRALRLDVDEDDAGHLVRHRTVEQRRAGELDEDYFVSEEPLGDGLDSL